MKTEINIWGKLFSSNHYGDHLEEPENNKTEEPLYEKNMTAEASEDVGRMGEKLEAADVPENQNE